MSGSLTKLKIESFTNADCDGESTGSYTVLINPDQIVMDSKIEYTTPESSGSESQQQIFSGITSPKLGLKLVFDGTGVLLASEQSAIVGAINSLAGNGSTEKLGTVAEQIEAFRKVSNYYNGTEHEPGYVRIAWGGIVFKGRLETFKVTYTLFKPDGTPIRALGDAGFVGSVDPATANKNMNKESPDLTHVRIVRKGETLPLMCQRIYKDSSRYLEIARVNKLSNYRRLEPGMKLFFPPIKSEA
ncbi:MAG: LysM peptidoglycan-binding domain-containing protein [Bacteroidetes bacterium]|nr:LysM peptidoglycan-binding domain-containing protein [Bacteroidota bacterium]